MAGTATLTGGFQSLLMVVTVKFQTVVAKNLKKAVECWANHLTLLVFTQRYALIVIVLISGFCGLPGLEITTHS